MRRGEIDRDSLLRKSQAGVENGGSHPLSRLADGTIRQTDQGERRKAAAYVDLDGDLVAGHSLEVERGYAGEHGRHARPDRVTRG